MVSYCLRYTCAYYKRPDMTLDEAQEAAKAHRAIGRSSMFHAFFSYDVPTLGTPKVIKNPWNLRCSQMFRGQAKMDLIAQKLDLKPGMPLG